MALEKEEDFNIHGTAIGASSTAREVEEANRESSKEEGEWLKKKRKLEQECQVALYRSISPDFKEAQDKSIKLEKRLEEAEDRISLVQTEL